MSYTDPLVIAGIITIWAIVSSLSVNLIHWMGVTKKWFDIPDRLWTTLLLTVFLPWSILALAVIITYVKVGQLKFERSLKK